MTPLEGTPLTRLTKGMRRSHAARGTIWLPCSIWRRPQFLRRWESPEHPLRPRCLPQPRRPLWPALPQQSIWRCWWQRCGRLSHLLSHRLRWPSRWWLLVRPCRPCLIRWTLVRCWVRGRARVLPLHPRHRHHLAKRDRGLDPVPDLTPDLVHILLRHRVRAGLRRPPLSSPISRRMSRPPSGMRKP